MEGAGKALDFLSAFFNPLEALQSPTCLPPVPTARPADNLHAFRRQLPPSHPDYIPATTPGPAHTGAPARESRRAYQRQLALRATRSWICPLEAIAASVKAGPLVLLKEAFSEQSSVLVITRHRKGIRGRCTGTLVAFDKHCNLVLRDVEEEYTVLLRGERGGRSAPRQERRRRSLGQLLVHGSSVVLVTRAAAALPRQA